MILDDRRVVERPQRTQVHDLGLYAVASEFLRTHLFSGFPWVLLGYSQSSVLPVVQLASLAGICGVSWLVANTAAAIAYGCSDGARRGAAAIVVAAGQVAVAWGWGTFRIARGTLTSAGSPVMAALVQGNVPQHQKWDPAHARGILARYLSMSREAAARGATLIVWPESSTPFNFEEDGAGGNAVRDLASTRRAWVLFGSDQADRGSAPRYYNAAFMLGPTGEVAHAGSG